MKLTGILEEDIAVVVGIHCIAVVVDNPGCCGSSVPESPTWLLLWRCVDVACMKVDVVED